MLKLLATFKLLILNLFFYWLLISILPIDKTSRNLEVEVKQHAIIAMFLDWLYNIVTLVIVHSPSLANGLEFMNAKRLGLKPLGLGEIEVRIGVLKWNTGTPSIILWHFLKTFLEACPSITFRCSNISSHYIVVWFEPYSLNSLFSFHSRYHISNVSMSFCKHII